MEQLTASSLHGLEGFISMFDKDSLFRGQLEHYGEPNNPHVIASFDRYDCIPSEMMKWMRYSREGANKQVISSQADSLIKISRIWADFFPANTSNQPI